MPESKLVNINITFKNTDSTDAIKSYTTEKVANCLKKFVHQNTEAHVVLKVERNRHIAEVSLHSDGHDFACKESSEDLYASIDALVAALAHQLRKHKERLTKHH